MHKFFNTAGPCQPARHYMIDPLPRLSGIRELIDDAHYFIIQANRQDDLWRWTSGCNR